MAISENNNGSTTTDGTEQTLATITTEGNYQFRIDLDNMVNGDSIEIRLKVEARTAESTAKILYLITLSHDQGEVAIHESPWVAVVTNGQLIVTLKRTGGSDRTYVWSVIKQP